MAHDKIHDISTDHSISSTNVKNYSVTVNSSSTGITLVPSVSALSLSPSGQFSTSVYSPTTIYFCNAVSGNITAIVPSASAETRMLIYKKIDATANTVTISSNIGMLIDSASAYTITTPYESISIASDLTNNWYIY